VARLPGGPGRWQAVGVATRLVHLVTVLADLEGSELCVLSPL
jgi:hypothetical protein